MFRGSILLLFCLGFNTIISAQTHFQVVGKSVYELRKETNQTSRAKPFQFQRNIATILPTKSKALQNAPQVYNYEAPKLYSYHNLAFFCRMEVKMDKAAKMPVRFRLGTVDYVDRLEGKY